MGRSVFWLLSVLSAVLLALAPSTVHAGGVEVQPISLTLSAKVPSAMLAVTNRNLEPVRFHVTAHTWSQKPNGEMVLEPTQDIMFFPAMLTLNPQEARNLRVGMKIKPGAIEKTYRVFVQELPHLISSASKNGAAVGIVSKMAIPVFVEPDSPKASPVVAGLSFQGGDVKFTIKNMGNVHFRPEEVALKAKAGETVLLTENLHPWYVLAGGVLEYSFRLPAEACAAANSLDLEVKSDRGKARASVVNVHCTP